MRRNIYTKGYRTMKRLACFLAVLLIAGAANAAWTNTWQWSANDADHNIQDAIDSISGNAGLNAGIVNSAAIEDESIVSADILDGTIAYSDLAATAVAQFFTNTTAINTLVIAPRKAGDILIGTVSGTVHIAKGATTNDWIAVLVP